MVDLATFRTFPRATPGRMPEALVAERDAPVETAVVADEAVSTRFSQELRARRRAARTEMRQSESWAEPDNVDPPVASPPAPLLRAGAESETEEEVPPQVEHVVTPLPKVARHWLHGEPPAPLTGEADLVSTPTVPTPNVDHRDFAPKPAPVVPTVAFAEAGPPLPSRPVPIHEFLAEPAVTSKSVAPALAALLETSESAAALFEGAPVEEERWPTEPPPTLEGGETIHIDPPKPLEPEAAEIAPVDPSPIFTLRDYFKSDPLDLDYRLLGLANPLVVTVMGRLGDAMPTPLTVGRMGLYRPDGFRPAPWSGFAYDVSPDGRTGLVLGTRILTARGEIPVEDLVPGDAALALRGPALLPIVWIGRSVAVPPPVEIAAGAFGPGRPSRPLRVGADHPIFVQTIPVPARDLVNGQTICILETETAELFHIDVGFAEVLLADGVPLSSGFR